MARQIQIRRGSAAEHATFTGAIGEITMDTTNKTLRVHDGTTPGGTALAKQSDIQSAEPLLPDFTSGTEITLPSHSTYTAPFNMVLVCNVGWGFGGTSELIIMRNDTDVQSLNNMLLAINLSNYACATDKIFLRAGDSIYIKSRSNAVGIMAYPLN